MIISLIVAAAENRAIGRDNALLWHISSDLKHFKAVTIGCSVIMGRRTFESIGRALPKRRNIVITRNPEYVAVGCEVVTSIDEALALVVNEDEVFVIGGGTIYDALWNKADKLYLTEVHACIDDADTFIPIINSDYWNEVSRVYHTADIKDDYNFSYVDYVKV